MNHQKSWFGYDLESCHLQGSKEMKLRLDTSLKTIILTELGVTSYFVTKLRNILLLK